MSLSEELRRDIDEIGTDESCQRALSRMDSIKARINEQLALY